MAQQPVDGAGDEVDGGLVPGDEQQEGHAQQFAGGEAVAVLRGAGQGAEEVVLRAPALGLDQSGEVAGHVLGRGGRGFHAGRHDHLVGPPAEGGAVGRRHAEEFADDGQREGEGEGFDEVGAAGG
ncbi:hypothetical protein GCM10020000_07740 [Streptomyces olivoverticillatus]